MMDKSVEKFLDRSNVSGILHVTIDNKLLHSLKFNEHVRVHIVFDAVKSIKEEGRDDGRSCDPASKTFSGDESMEFSDFEDGIDLDNVGHQTPKCAEDSAASASASDERVGDVRNSVVEIKGEFGIDSSQGMDHSSQDQDENNVNDELNSTDCKPDLSFKEIMTPGLSADQKDDDWQDCDEVEEVDEDEDNPTSERVERSPKSSTNGSMKKRVSASRHEARGSDRMTKSHRTGRKDASRKKDKLVKLKDLLSSSSLETTPHPERKRQSARISSKWYNVKKCKINCQFCSRSFQQQEDYIGHHTAVSNRQFSCEKCPQVFDYKAHLMVHTMTDHSEGKNRKDAGETYGCDQCGLVVKKLKTIQSHMMRHTGEFGHRCCVCKFKCRHLKDLTNHLSMHLRSDDSMSSSDESISRVKVKQTKVRLSRSRQNTTSTSKSSANYATQDFRPLGSKKSPLSCDICYKTFKTRKESLIHNTTEGTKRVSCDKCSKEFDWRADLLVHDMLVHADKKPGLGASGTYDHDPSGDNSADKNSTQELDNNGPYKCSQCDRVTYKVARLKKHMLIHTGEYSYKCCVCNYRCREERSFRDHRMRHNNLKPKPKRSKKTLSRANHTGDILKLQTLGGNVQVLNQFINSPPSKEKRASQGLHTNTSEALSSAEKKSGADGDKKGKVYHCQFCSQTFIKEKEFRSHHQIEAVDWKCRVDKCNMVYKYKASLLVHEIMHHRDKGSSSSTSYDPVSGARLHKCTYCTKTYAQKSRFETHMLMHTDENLWQCCVCNYKTHHTRAFTKHLTRHIRTVGGEKRIVPISRAARAREGDAEVSFSLEPEQDLYTSKTYLPLLPPHPPVYPYQQYDERKVEPNPTQDAGGSTDSTGCTEFCRWCTKYFKTPEAMEAHQRVNLQLPCNKCHQVFECKAYLMVHDMFCDEYGVDSSSNASRDKYACSQCGLVIKPMKSLKQHMALHTDEMVYLCCICNRRFLTPKQLRSHLARHAADGARAASCKFQCSLCKSCFTTRGGLDNHRILVHKFECGLCNETFSLKSARNNHYKTVHPDEALKCEECYQFFPNQDALSHHQTYHRISNHTKTQCPTCGVVITANSMRRHMKKHADLDGGGPFACDQCPRICPTSISLQNHILRSHRVSKMDISCDVCFKPMKSHAALASHYRRVHLNDKVFFCEVCGKSCNRKSNLKIHMKVHEKRTPLGHNCSQCGVNFPSEVALNDHVKLNHSQSIPACEPLPLNLNQSQPQPPHHEMVTYAYSSTPSWPIFTQTQAFHTF